MTNKNISSVKDPEWAQEYIAMEDKLKSMDAYPESDEQKEAYDMMVEALYEMWVELEN